MIKIASLKRTYFEEISFRAEGAKPCGGWFLPGQHCVLQFCEYVIDPEQVVPPHEGEGLLQLLERDLVPVPHVLVQEVHLPQYPQFPLTKMLQGFRLKIVTLLQRLT